MLRLLASALPTPPPRCQPFASGYGFSAGIARELLPARAVPLQTLPPFCMVATAADFFTFRSPLSAFFSCAVLCSATPLGRLLESGSPGLPGQPGAVHRQSAGGPPCASLQGSPELPRCAEPPTSPPASPVHQYYSVPSITPFQEKSRRHLPSAFSVLCRFFRRFLTQQGAHHTSRFHQRPGCQVRFNLCNLFYLIKLLARRVVFFIQKGGMLPKWGTYRLLLSKTCFTSCICHLIIVSEGKSSLQSNKAFDLCWRTYSSTSLYIFFSIIERIVRCS